MADFAERAEAAARRGEYREAARLAERGLGLVRSDASALERLLDRRAAYLESAGDLPGAASAARELVARVRTSARGYLRLGKVLRLLGEHARARAVYTGALGVVRDARGAAALRAQLGAMDRARARRAGVDVLGALPPDVVMRVLSYLGVRTRWAALTSCRAGLSLIPACLSHPRLLRRLVKKDVRISVAQARDVEVFSAGALLSLGQSPAAPHVKRLTVSSATLTSDYPRSFKSLSCLRMRNCRIQDPQSLVAWLRALPVSELRIDSCTAVDLGQGVEVPKREDATLAVLAITNCGSQKLWPWIAASFPSGRVLTDLSVEGASVCTQRPAVHYGGRLALSVRRSDDVPNIPAGLHTARLWSETVDLTEALDTIARTSPRMTRLFVGGATPVSSVLSAAARMPRLALLGVLHAPDAGWAGTAYRALLQDVRARCPGVRAVLVPALDARREDVAPCADVRLVTDPALCEAIAGRYFRLFYC